MKKTNFKLLTSAIALGLASISTIGSTFAWFSMNTTVVASGMSVTAKTNGSFLQIKNASGDANTDTAGTTATANVTANGDDSIFPAKYVGVADTPDKWQYGYSDSYTVGTVSGAYKDVTNDDVDKYRLANSFSIFTKDKGTTVTDLKVQDYTITGTSAFIDAIGIVVVCGKNIQKIASKDVTTAEANSVASATVLAATVGSDKDDTSGAVTVNVYVYFDGDNALITSEKAAVAANISSISVDITFTSSAAQ